MHMLVHCRHFVSLHVQLSEERESCKLYVPVLVAANELELNVW
jgi:hypothetical protein